MFKNNTRLLTEMAIIAAITLLLDKIIFFKMPQGGSVSLVMVPIVLLGIRRGFKIATITASIVGIIQFIFGGYFLTIFQLFLDYILSFALMGTAGFLHKPFQKTNSFFKQSIYITFANLLAASFRFLSNFLSGFIFFGQYAPKGTPAILYSFLYNITYIIPSMLLSIIVMIALNKVHSSFLKV